ncbi:unnamed protein product [Soboliphyme baturini]|uniref:Major sperm protein n=1 Tax=Soboliphyme baturini TaxID=241478 RepID=A0A183IDB2_9BILA|nr:unnamed protein product [Soboliphyme baturini]
MDESDEQLETLKDVDVLTKQIFYRLNSITYKTVVVPVMNPTSNAIGFMVKVSSRKYMSANPKYGILEKGEHELIEISFHPMPEENKGRSEEHELVTIIFAVMPKNKNFKTPSDIWTDLDNLPKPVRCVEIPIIYIPPRPEESAPKKEAERRQPDQAVSAEPLKREAKVERATEEEKTTREANGGENMEKSEQAKIAEQEGEKSQLT